MLRLFLAFMLAVQPVLAADLPDLGEVSRQYFSDQDEQALGRAIMRDVYADPRYLDDPEIETYLNQLGYRLVSVSGRNQRTFTFFVVDDPTINAFALPGGNIGVHTGLLLAAQSESELAGVIAHEISHVTQNHLARMVEAQSQSYWPTMAALALALLASRSNPNVAGAAIASTQAYSIQNQLAYTREYEREADRLGYDMLTRAGFDPRAMSTFFERLQRANRFYDTSAPAYLRTHPLTSERIADMEARSDSAPYRQVQGSLEFQLVRARLRARENTPDDAVIAARGMLKDKRYSSEVAARYGLVSALLRARRFKEAEAELQKLPSGKNADPMILQLGAYAASAAGNLPLALQRYQQATTAYPGYRPLQYGYLEALLSAQRSQDALAVANGQLALYPQDRRLWRLAAQTHAQLGHRLQSHRAQAEADALSGDLVAAIEQINLGIKAGDGDFHEMSAAEAQRREWVEMEKEQRKKK
ncbi:beta-barrel assembly-enhancing protease [Thiobacillus sedimenti]|uniref:M48 family metalloprotease n=1 Tax=Thiobacillus sedimenti TaxID=3110231 RepID=A0ABZ1CKI8_9PROT|nr:M48 family metalloprotease [Thiobacillus sp. SCUT-2]WRS39879.1 M48 family metalloprotease [Thiobacillus sp. SCUT-2]